ncbi:MAG: transcription termination factor NusA [Blastocatellia bacterium]|nr:transcription termination factor NusA [Chloracidobacterium sp.]MBL8184792.1 transcription termination factor NusA [Blastocatellia bacterium]HBE81921.1 transcription termination/antitermination protein NusA [Blastocatellia bacterium]HRJ87124.1 transcription termination factor NusA [Pyrinomonadaceae bacterium]HRK51363.1 transcription termination factor NusA [Pyrinomonadaceae bacterium]
MTSSIGQSIDALCSEQGLDRDMVIEAMKDAVKAAARKQFRNQDKTGDSIQVDWNNEEGMIEISVQKTVVEEVENPSAELSLTDAQEMAGDEIEVGDMLLIPLPQEEMGRIAAQTAKQILVQKVREAIREKVYDEYIDRKGELINGMVKRFERGDIIIDLGNNLEAVLPRSEQSRGELWNQGERVRVVIVDVSKEQKGQQIKVSRASSELIKRLFEMEVPEIYDETVVIKSAVREPGDRAKIAVASNEKDVDPVGACVGMKGSRVQSIIKELRGEKIDIIEWSDEPSVFAANALSPAKVSQVRITDINNRQMEVIVGEDQLSLAIGKKGQNVRLATRLVGWDINIVSEDVLKKEIALQMGQMMASGEAVPITALQGVSANQAETLAEKGITDVEALASTSLDDLVEYLDVSLDEAESILSSAAAIVEAKNLQIGETGAVEGPEESEGDGETAQESTDQPADSADEIQAEELEPSADVEAAEAETSEPASDETDVAAAEDEPATEPEDAEAAIGEDAATAENEQEKDSNVEDGSASPTAD